MSDPKIWAWKVITSKGDFFISVIGSWPQEKAVEILWEVFQLTGLGIIGLIPRKTASGPRNRTAAIMEKEGAKAWPGYSFCAGRDIWEACNRLAEFEAETILSQQSQK